MNDLDVVTSTRALTVKFSIPNGIGCVHGEQYLARRYYKEAVKMGVRGKKVNMVLRGKPHAMSKKEVSHNLDPREVDADRAMGPVEELEHVQVSELDVERCLKLGQPNPRNKIPAH